MNKIEKLITVGFISFTLYGFSLIGTLMYTDDICLQQGYVKPHVSATYTGYCSKLIDGTSIVTPVKDLK